MVLNKTIVAIGIATIALAALAGCSSSSSSSAPATSSPTQAAASTAPSVPANNKIILITGVAGDSFYQSMICEAVATATKAGWVLENQAPTQWDAALQRPIVDAAVAAKPAAIIFVPDDGTAMQAPAQSIKDAGIPLVLADTTLDDPSIAVSQVTSDNVKIGAGGFEALRTLVPDGGSVLFLGSTPGVTTGDQREKGFKDAAAADSKFKLLDSQYGADDAAKSTGLISAAIAAHPDLVGIFAASFKEAEGAATAVAQAGKQGKIFVVGVDADPGMVQALRDGTVQALIAQQPGTMGSEAVNQAIAAATGQPTKPLVETGISIITKDNIDSPESVAAFYRTECK